MVKVIKRVIFNQDQRPGDYTAIKDFAMYVDGKRLEGEILRKEQARDFFLEAYRRAHPDLAGELERRLRGDLPKDWRIALDEFVAGAVAEAPSVATRVASQKVLDALGSAIPEMLGGSADLTGSNNTNWKGSVSISSTVTDGNYIHYGVREFGMTAMMNGMALHGGFIPYGGTFLVFSDYARNAVRMSALMKQRVINVYTHDSIGLGEDGPTHQPIEHVSSLRLIPNSSVWRPCDMVETAVAWKAALERKDGPSSLILTRQGLPHQNRSDEQIANIARGGYILRDTDGTPDAIVIATGSEVGIAMEAAESLAGKGKKVRVVSMPSTDLFDKQDAAYRESVLPAAVTKRVAVEAGVTSYWAKYVGLEGRVVGIDRFGESAPAKDLFKEFGFTAENVAKTVEELL